MRNQKQYEMLADYLSDHLWNRNNLDYDFLKSFPEFIYNGPAYRILYLSESQEIKDFTHQSFSKSLDGIVKFGENVNLFDKDFIKNKSRKIFECEIEGFDVNKALTFFKENRGLTENTINNFINEDEIICFSFRITNIIEHSS